MLILSEQLYLDLQVTPPNLLRTLNWLVLACKLHKNRAACCTAEWPYCPLIVPFFKQRIFHAEKGCIPQGNYRNVSLMTFLDVEKLSNRYVFYQVFFNCTRFER